MGLRESRGEVSRQINCFDFQLEWFRNRKNTSFYRNFGRNRPIEKIDGYDETVHRGPFQLSHSCPIEKIDGYDETVHRGPFQLSHSRPILMDGLDDPRRWTL